MNLNKKGFSTVLMGAVAASSLLLVACGGGGGGGSSASTVTYTGLTTAATIDATSAPAIADSVISTAATDTSGLPTFVGVSGTAGDVAAVDNLKSIADTAKRVAAVSPTVESLAGVQVSDSQTIPGCYGSSATISASYDDTYTYYDPDVVDYFPIIYSSSITFNNFVFDLYGDGTYCFNQRFNGSMSITSVSYDGPIDSTPEVNGMTITFRDLSVTEIESGLNQAFNGTMVTSLDTTTRESSLSLTADFRDIDGLVYRAENYTVDADSNGNVTTVSGRLYDPAYGYVDLTTTESFSYTGQCIDPVYYSPVPDAGLLRIDGANGGYIEINAATGDCTTYMLTWSDGVVTADPIFVNW